MVAALLSELGLRRDYLSIESIATIYFGGGTPSLLDISDLVIQLEKISSTFNVDANVETTMEVNPDDVTHDRLQQWKDAGINRLSIGIQSFFEEDLKWMNRAHNSRQAITSLQAATKYFDNISVDLIYGTPFLTDEKWKDNIDRTINLGIPHLSCYALTVEPKTPLYKMIRAHQSPDIDSDKQSEQFLLLMDRLEHAGYEHYEISNFARPGYRSRHNSGYWSGERYIGIGPSAHSYDGFSRQWNVSNNNMYMEAIKKGIVPCEKEILTPVQRVNEYIMTSLRTIEGLDLNHMSKAAADELLLTSKNFVERKLMVEEEGRLKLTGAGKLLADGIASDLFVSENSLLKTIS
jgi:oxygen-independent coproporphyrinogen-3 oxidase